MKSKRLILAISVLTAASIVLLTGLTNKTPVPLPGGTEIDSICIKKAKREMEIFSKGKLLKSYDVSLGSNPEGPKRFEGDCKTPEGLYSIDFKNPESKYHLFLGISYPNADDSAFAKSHGKSAGSAVGIHGLPNGSGHIGRAHLKRDWTLGCIAVTNKEIEEIYEATDIGTPIFIMP
jgi:murein L,D-transpeptidase YafK